MHTDDAIRNRRSAKTYDDRPLPEGTLDELLALAVLAPNHRLTQPWRFAVADRPAVGRLAAFLAGSAAGAAIEPRKLAKNLDLLRPVAALIQVTCLRSADPVTAREDRDATAAAVQTLLLAATARGLGSFWSTSPLFTHPDTLRWFGADPAAEDHVATIWLGWPALVPAKPPRRPLAECVRRT
jgi:nitroreductase